METKRSRLETFTQCAEWSQFAFQHFFGIATYGQKNWRPSKFQPITPSVTDTWVPAEFFPGVGNEGSEGWKSPSRVQGQLPGGSLGAKAPEAGDIFKKK